MENPCHDITMKTRKGIYGMRNVCNESRRKVIIFALEGRRTGIIQVMRVIKVTIYGVELSMS